MNSPGRGSSKIPISTGLAPAQPRLSGRAGLRRATALSMLLAAVGCSPSFAGPRRALMEASPQYSEGKFHNVVSMAETQWLKMISAQFRASNFRSPSSPEELPIETVSSQRFDKPPPSGLRITWLGHSSVLVELDGYRVLTDPVWSKRASPFSWVGPARFHAPPLALEDLPDIDAVVLSHDHYDHLDEGTVRQLAQLPANSGQGLRVAQWAVPLGVGQHLEQFGVSSQNIVERDWWQEAKVGDLVLTCTPARHFSGRSLTFSDRDNTLWAGWAMRGPQHAVYFTGDTGLFEGLSEIGKRLGPFDAALVETGAYSALWSDVHLGPEQAVLAHQMLQAELYFPVHWGTFDLAMHGWTEPVERVLQAAQAKHVAVAVPRPGQSVEPAMPPQLTRWWPQHPWQTAAEAPVVSTHLPASLTDRLSTARFIPQRRVLAP